MLQLRVMGSTDLRRGDREIDSFLAGRKRLGLLAYLVLARPRGFRRRDTLLSLFWPETGQEAARNALSNMLYHVRRELGDDILVNRGAEEVGIRRENMWCDAVECETLLDSGDARHALTLYRGELLEGFHVPGASPDFDQWLDGERERLKTRAAEAAWELAEEAEESGDPAAMRSWATTAAAFHPLSDEAQKRLISLLHRSGDRAGALRAYDDFAARLKAEWDMLPASSLVGLVEDIRSAPAGTKAPSAQRAHAGSLAVMPFAFTGGEAHAAFAEGIHGDLLTRLSNVSALRVISRTSVRRYRGSRKTLTEIGAELRVPWIVEGEVQEAGGEVRVRVRLVDAREDRQAWADSYRRSLTAATLFRIQEDIATEIARAVEAELSPEERRRLAANPTANLDAYRLNALGRVQLDQRTEAAIRRGIDYFRCALELDPEFALAWVGLADALSLFHDYGFSRADAELLEADEAVRRALSLDPDLAEAHASLGLLHSVRFEGPAAIRQLNHAVELRPSYSEAHNWLSWVHLLLGNRREALEHALQAVELNPLSPEAVSNLSLSYLVNGQRRKAMVEAQRERELGSTWGTGRFYEGLALYEMGRYSDAINVLQGVSAAWAGEGPRATLALAHVEAGEREEARRILDGIEQEGDTFAAGLVRMALGDADEGLGKLMRTDSLSDWPALAIRHLYANVWSRLREDSRIGEIRRRLDAVWGLAGPASAPARMDPAGLAVLPFHAFGGGEDSMFFAAGLHDDLLTKLSRVGTLTVISRASVQRFVSDRSSIPEFARALGVATVVEGVVRLAGHRLRLNVQLVDARNEALRWAETYDRELTADNVFELQNELAERIAGNLHAEVTAAEKGRVDRRPTGDLEAFRLYTHGRLNLDLRTRDGMHAALGYFRRAIDQDAGYALAWAGLAEAISLLEFYGFDAPAEAPAAIEAATRAVRLGPDLGESHAAKGIAHAVREEGADAVRLLEHAIELAPGYAEAHIWLGWVLLCLGRPRKALAAAKRALQLNPLAPAVRVYLAEICLACDDEQEAYHHARRAREIQPGYALAHFTEGLVLHHLQRYEEAASALRHALGHVHRRGSPTEAEVRALHGIILIALGDEPSARVEVAAIDAELDPFPAALAAAALGETDAAFALLAEALSTGTLRPEFVRYYLPDVLGPLRRDPRFGALLSDLNNRWGAEYAFGRKRSGGGDVNG